MGIRMIEVDDPGRMESTPPLILLHNHLLQFLKQSSLPQPPLSPVIDDLTFITGVKVAVKSLYLVLPPNNVGSTFGEIPGTSGREIFV
jgi:hypothetical protein